MPIILGIDPGYSKPIYVARFVDGVFDNFQCVQYPYAEQPVMFFDAFKRIFRSILNDAECQTCGWEGKKEQMIPIDSDVRNEWEIAIASKDAAPNHRCPRCAECCCKVKEGGALVAIEKPVFIKVNYRSFIEIHEVYVALKTIAQYEGLRFIGFAPSSWRKAHGFRQGKGVKSNELKVQAVEMVEEMTGRRFLGRFSEQADMCESYLIALAAMKPKHKTVTIKE